MSAHFCVYFPYSTFHRNEKKKRKKINKNGSSRSTLRICCSACSSLICMRSALRSALIARRGHLGIKKKKKMKKMPKYWALSNHPNTVGIANRTATPPSQSTNHYYFILSLSLSRCLSLCQKLYYAQVVGRFGSSLCVTPPTQPHPQPRQLWSGFLLRNHRWLCGRKWCWFYILQDGKRDDI